MPKIWVDADATPRVIKEILIKAGQRRQIEVYFVANSHLGIQKSHFIKTVRVASGDDIADDYIVENCMAGDLVITADIPLASRVIDKEAVVLRPRGSVLDANNISQKLSLRDFSTDLREMGINTGGAPPFHPKDKQKFSNALDRWLTRGFL